MKNIVHRLNQRREQLGMSQNKLAQLADISLPTIQRFFAHSDGISLDTVCEIAHVLGMSLITEEEISGYDLLKRQAHTKARQLTSIVLGTSALEAQGIDASASVAVEEKMFYKLMSGPKSKIWSS